MVKTKAGKAVKEKGEKHRKINEICNADFIAWENFAMAMSL